MKNPCQCGGEKTVLGLRRQMAALPIPKVPPPHERECSALLSDSRYHAHRCFQPSAGGVVRNA
jgi:hypothetical protein